MNLLYITPFLRVPADFGMGIRNYHIVQHLAQHHQVQVLTFGEDAAGSTNAWLTAQGCGVVRLPYAVGWGQTFGRWATLRELPKYPGLSFARFDARALAQAIQQLLVATPAEAVIFDTQLTGQALLHLALPVPALLVLADVYEEVRWRQLQTGGWRPYTLVYAADWWKARHYERRIVRRFRHLVAVAAAEQTLLQKRYPHAEVFLSPNGMAVQDFVPPMQPSAAEGVLFVGGFEHAPNVAAFTEFATHIWPQVLAHRPNARFMAVGRNPTPAMHTLAQQIPNITLTGTVPSVQPYYAQARVVVTPVRQGGGGAKLKTLEAFAAGVPVVSTSVGCEGITADIDQYVYRADAPAEFAAHVSTILADPTAAQAKARHARALVETHFAWPHLAAAFDDYVRQVVQS